MYNRKEIFSKAHKRAKLRAITFSEALHESWKTAKIALRYKLNEIIRVSSIADNICKAKQQLSKVIIKPVVFRKSASVDMVAAMGFYSDKRFKLD